MPYKVEPLRDPKHKERDKHQLTHTGEELTENRKKFIEYLFRLDEEELLEGSLWSDEGVCITGALCEVSCLGKFQYVYGVEKDDDLDLCQDCGCQAGVDFHHGLICKGKLYHCNPPAEVLGWIGITQAEATFWVRMNDNVYLWENCKDAAYWMGGYFQFPKSEVERMRQKATS